jgi:ketosteroid isomerase-like protein
MKTRLLLACAGLAISFAMPAVAQEQNTIDPEVRQQIEALIVNLDEAYNKSDAQAVAALFAQDAVEVWYGQPEGGLASGQQAIEKRYAGELGPGPTTFHTSFFKRMQSAVTYARSWNGVCRQWILLDTTV